MTSLSLKLIVFAFMIFGHIIIIWFPENKILRLGDYWVYPAFCYFAGVGLRETKDFSKYLCSMVLLALISQMPFLLARITNPWQLNILFHLSFSLGVVYMARKSNNYYIYAAGLVGAFLMPGGFNTVVGIVIIGLVAGFYDKLPKLKKGNLRISKYWLYSVYPGHLAILGGLRQII